MILLVFRSSCPVPLAAIFEPVSYLSGGQARSLSKFSFLARVGVGILEVPLPQQRPGSLLETVGLLLAIPNCPRHRELLPDAIFIDRS